MKTPSLITVIFLFISMMINGQEYVPFPLEDATWTVFVVTSCDNDGPPDTLLLRYSLSGDTTVNDIVYTKLLVEKGDTVNPVFEPVGGLREENKKVYFFGRDFLGFDHQELLLYDFNAETGDTICHEPSYGPMQSIILDIDSFQIAGHYRKRYLVDNNWFCHNPDYIIEGIGSVINGLMGHVTMIPTCGYHYWEHVCYSERGQVLYKNPSYSDCYAGVNLSHAESFDDLKMQIVPNPFKEHLDIFIPDLGGELNLRIFDAQGKLMGEMKIVDARSQVNIDGPPGIYILSIEDQNGLIREMKVVKE